MPVATPRTPPDPLRPDNITGAEARGAQQWHRLFSSLSGLEYMPQFPSCDASPVPSSPTGVRGIRRITYSGATVVGAACSCALALKFLPVSFFWIGLILAASSLVIAAFATAALRLPITLAATVPLAFGLGELVSPPVIYRTEVPSSLREDALLGWSLKPSQVSHATAEIKGERIYHVAYSTNSAGFRVSPPDRGEQVDGCLLFFSDSFTFGEGVSDDQTLPYQVGLQTDGRFRILNLSVPGYGAEQMLAAMQKGDLATDLSCQPTHIFYAALPHHILRAAHKTSYSVYGPRYRLGANGNPEYLDTNPGQSPDPNSVDWLELIKVQLRKSRILRALKDRPPQTTEADIALYFAIVREAFRLFERQWPEAELHVISWDIHDFFAKGKARFHHGLKTIHAQVHLIDDILPGYTQDLNKYGIHPRDLHPNALAHRLVAAYLSQQVLSPRSSAKAQVGSD
jgi:hypothetical protein